MLSESSHKDREQSPSSTAAETYHADCTRTSSHEKGEKIPQNQVDSIVCKWFYSLMKKEIDVQKTIMNTTSELSQL